MKNEKYPSQKNKNEFVAYPEYKEMWVSDVDKIPSNRSEKRIAIGELYGKVVAFSNAEEVSEIDKESYYLTMWNYATEIKETPKSELDADLEKIISQIKDIKEKLNTL